jgi:Spy/CpxP family protein refolding chaperone
MFGKVGVALIATVLLSAGAMAQPASQPASQPGPRDLMQVHVPGFTLPEALDQLDLTADQKARVQAILTQAQQNLQALTPPQRQQLIQQRQELHQEVQAARQSGDKQALAAALQKLKQFQETNAESLATARQQVAQVLTPVQRAKLAYLMGAGGHFERLVALVGQLNLTAAQREKLNQIADQTRQAVRDRVRDAVAQRLTARQAARTGPSQPGAASQPQAPAGAGSRPIVQAIQDVMNLLAPEQQAELKTRIARRAAGNVLENMMAGLNLTADQKQKIVEIIAAERAKADENGEAQPQVLQAIRKRIVTEVLTDQQKQILAQRHQKAQPPAAPPQ